MGHAFRGQVHRVSSDHDGELTLVFKIPRQYYDEVTAVGNLTNQMLFVTVLTEEEVAKGGDDG